jgi:hypothetical protein
MKWNLENITVLRMIAFLTVIVLCIVSCRETLRNDDPKVLELIRAVVEYEQINEQAPKYLEELVPDYLIEIPKPRSVQTIYYEVNLVDETWVISWETHGGLVCGYSSAAPELWLCRLPIPDN